MDEQDLGSFALADYRNGIHRDDGREASRELVSHACRLDRGGAHAGSRHVTHSSPQSRPCRPSAQGTIAKVTLPGVPPAGVAVSLYVPGPSARPPNVK